MLENKRLAILFVMFFDPPIKMTTSFTNVARTTGSISKFLYCKKFQTIRN